MLNFIKNILKLKNKRSSTFMVSTCKDALHITPTKEIKILIKKFVGDNIKFVKSIHQDINENIFSEFQEVLYLGILVGVKYSILSNELQRKFLLDKKSADLIAKDQINRIHADLTRHRHKELGITEYKWSTCKDERVRNSHQVLEGKICSYDNVNVYKDAEGDKKWLKRSEIGAALSHPGQEIMCRCTPLAVIKL